VRARGFNRALLCGPSTSPVGASEDVFVTLYAAAYYSLTVAPLLTYMVLLPLQWGAYRRHGL
jgi:hypothetical protein